MRFVKVSETRHINLDNVSYVEIDQSGAALVFFNFLSGVGSQTSQPSKVRPYSYQLSLTETTELLKAMYPTQNVP